MPKLQYLAHILSSVRPDKLRGALNEVHGESGWPKLRIALDLAWCALRYGAGLSDYVLYGFYDLTAAQRDTYVTRIRNKRICDRMNQDDQTSQFEDKLWFAKKMAPYMKRKILGSLSCTQEELLEFLEGTQVIFAKPSHGSGGSGIERLLAADFASPEDLLEYVRRKKLDVLEEALVQHPEAARLHPSSVNTLRVVTNRVGNEVSVAYASLRVGMGNSFCDNACLGGVYCRVDPESGRVSSMAADDHFHLYTSHPETGIPFVGYQLPLIPEALAMAKEAALQFDKIRHIGWDMALTVKGPAIIEGNSFPGDMYQLKAICPQKEGLWPYYKKILSQCRMLDRTKKTDVID